MDQNDLVGHCKFSDRLLRVLEKRKQCDAENIMVIYRKKSVKEQYKEKAEIGVKIQK